MGACRMQKTLDFNDAWNDAISLLRIHKEAAIAIAGVFIFLPTLIYGYMFPPPDFVSPPGSDAYTNEVLTYFSGIAPWLLPISILAMIGTLAINCVVLNNAKPTTGQSIGISMKKFFTLFVASIVSGFVVMFGFIFLFVPGIYLMVKFSQVANVIAAEDESNPITALTRSWAVTKGNSLRIFAFLLIIGIVGYIAMIIIDIVLGGGAKIVLPAGAGLLFVAFVSAFTATIFNLIMLFVYMAIYRQLGASQ
jgi:hypothetical protein